MLEAAAWIRQLVKSAQPAQPATVHQVECEVGVEYSAWGTIDPELIIAAVMKLVTPQQPAQPAGVRMLTYGEKTEAWRACMPGDRGLWEEHLQRKFAEVNGLTVKPS
jgi:hypothetical protein